LGTSPDARWVTIAFSCNGLSVLGIDDTSLATFPEEFRQGMAARADVLGLTGENHPAHWRGDVASRALHALVILFARDVAERDRCERQHRHYLSTLDGVSELSSLNLEALPPFDGIPREHFGYRDRLSQPVIEGTCEQPTPGSGPALKAGEFFLGYQDETGNTVPLPRPSGSPTTAVTSRICAWKNTSAAFDSSCGSTRRRRINRSCWRRS
jgi:hypothetical protein